MLFSYNVWDGTYSMWDMKVGVCCDFSNVMVIMLREHGIPATSLESDTHMWNLIYIDGRWYEHDITTMLQTHVTDFEATEKVNYGKNYRDYFSYKSTNIISAGADIWTIERANRKK